MLDKETLITMFLSYMESSQTMIQAQTAQIKSQTEQIKALTSKIENLTTQIALMNQRQFGKKSEAKLADSNQLSFKDMDFGDDMIFNEAESLLDKKNAPEAPVDEITVNSHKRKKRKGKLEDDLAGFPVTVVNHILSDEELAEKFPEGYTKLPDEVYKKLEMIPASFEVKEHHIAVYKGKNGKMAKGKHSDELIQKSIATPSLVSFVMNAKYTNAVPLYRLEQEFQRNDVNISRQNMANWMILTSERYLSLVYDRLKAEIVKSSVVHADETPVSVKNDGREGMHKSYMWVYQNGGYSDSHQAVIYDYQKTRKKDAPAKLLKDFNGVLVTDGYQVYHSLENDKATEFKVAGCWAHAKRKFADIIKANGIEKSKGTLAYQIVGHIQYIYQLDNQFKDLKPGERLRKRKALVKPYVDDFFEWIKDELTYLSKSSKTAEAIRYCINQEKYLRVFLDNPEIPLDNNAAERSIRPFCVGKKNWKMIDTVHGAEASAMIYSIVETSKLNGLNIRKYLEYLLTEIPKHVDETSMDFIEELLPWSESLPDDCRKRK